MSNGINGSFRRLVAVTMVAVFTSSAAIAGGLDEWVKGQRLRSRIFLLDNLSPAGTTPGVVIASPSRSNPDYFYHWVRDAALVMNVVVDLYLTETDESRRADYAKRLSDFIDFSRKNQLTPTPSGGLGEPKFNVDGTPFTGPWGRPQNDGPALRAVTLARLAHSWLDEGREADVRAKLYDGKLPARTVIKEDLEFVAHRWRDTSFDLWEEISGKHLYTRMVQRRALVDGAVLADRLGDGAAATFYRQQASVLERELARHWAADRGLLLVTLDRDAGIDYKHSGIDASVILASMHGATPDGFLGVTDERMLSTFVRIRDTFRSLYRINRNDTPGVAIGRYPEDRYDGNGFAGGNPWFLLTLGFAEFLYRLAHQIEAAGKLPAITDVNREFFASHGIVRSTSASEAARKLRVEGDAYVARARFHTDSSGRMAEQLNRDTGFMQGAHDLTWSYASFLSAMHWRR